MGNKEKYGIPFKKGVIDEPPDGKSHPSKFLPSSSRPELFIRTNDLDKDYVEGGKRRVRYGEVTIAKKEFKLLKDQYGIECSPRFVIGEDDNGEPVVFIVDDTINGKNIVNDSFDGKEIKEIAPKLDQLFSSVLGYLVQKYRGGEPMLADIEMPRQYFYSSETGKIHLADTDIMLFTRPTKEDVLQLILNSIGYQEFDSYIGKIRKTVYKLPRDDDAAIRLEKKFKTNFTESRKKLQEFIESLSEAERERYAQQLNKIREFLRNPSSIDTID